MDRVNGWAIQLRTLYGITGIVSDDDLDQILEDLDINVVEAELPFGVREALATDMLFLRPDLDHRWRRWPKAHAIGHFVLHAGDQFQIDDGVLLQQERQADLFAGAFLLGQVIGCVNRSEPWAVWDIADEALVPEESIRRWLESASALVS